MDRRRLAEVLISRGFHESGLILPRIPWLESIHLMSARFIPIFVALSWLPVSAADYRELFREARAVQDHDPAVATEKMRQCFHAALAEGNHEYAITGGLNAAIMLYDRNETVAAGKLAREVINSLQAFDDTGKDNTSRRTQLFNFIGSGLLAEGKIGAALQANRASADVARGKILDADGDGSPMTLADAIKLPPVESGYAFGIMERRSHLLELSGNAKEARRQLDEVEKWLGNDWPGRLRPMPRFYAFKLLATRAQLLDYLAYKEEAIRAQEKLLATPPDERSHQSRLNLRINLLRNRSQWSGPTEEIMQEAREVAAMMKKYPIHKNVDRLLANMEFDLKQSREALDLLNRNERDNLDLGNEFDATFARRDNLFARARLGDPGLDPEFFDLLKTVRGRGQKSSEPPIYRAYGSYLLKQDRPSEAIQVLVECLRQLRGLGLDLHQPSVIAMLIDARITAGDLDGARATLVELENWLRDHPDAPAQRRAGAVASRAVALAKLGDTTAARAAFALARQIGKDLPDYQKRDYTAAAEERLLEKTQAPVVAATTGPAPVLRVQPLELLSVVPPGQSAKTRFSVFNPGARSLPGHLVVTGKGASLGTTTSSVSFDPTGNSTTVKIPRTLKAGEEFILPVSMASSIGTDEEVATVAWENTGSASGPPATWKVTWSATSHGATVLDASSLEANPFRSVALYHELAVPPGEATGVAFRLRSPVPLRLEYLDAATGTALAVDANGNGDFTEAGDFYLRTRSGASGAVYPLRPGENTLTAEVRIFSPDGQPLLTAGSTLVLEAEIFLNGSWVKQAEDIIR